MKEMNPFSRRTLLKAAAVAPFTFGLAAYAPAYEPTPHIEDNDEPTPEETEGPFFKPKSPQRTSLRDVSIKGTTLIVAGRVITTTGASVVGALLDFWHCDASGDYDNEGFKLRGHQYTDKDGAFRLETIVPGVYPGRTRHIHVKAQAPRGRILTTQLYFPGEPRNKEDELFMPQLAMKISQKDEIKTGAFDFVLST